MKSSKSNSVEEYLASKPKARGTSRASKPRKPVTKSKSPPKAGTKAKPGASEAKPVTLLSGGNPQIAKAEGNAPVQAYNAAMPGWKSDLGMCAHQLPPNSGGQRSVRVGIRRDPSATR